MNTLINGQKYNHLTVIQTGIRNAKDNRLMVKCRCDCGKEKIIRQSDLLSGHTKTCGCNIKTKRKKRIRVVIPVGQRFGKLVVVNNEITYNNKPHMVKCKCDCGEELYVQKYLLTHNFKTQCKKCKCKRKNTEKEGYRQGHLVITKEIDEKHFEVHCDCGNTVIMSKINFYHSQYCKRPNCIFKKVTSAKMKQNRAKKEIGNRYGRLTVISEVELLKQIQSVRTLVKCKCNCGNFVDTSLFMLKFKLKQSCGCLKSEKSKENQKKAVEGTKIKYNKK